MNVVPLHKQVRPLIRRGLRLDRMTGEVEGVWICRCDKYYGVGSTIQEAYGEWKFNRRRLK